ncbi:MAG: hypothetical protein V7K69_09135 [Nostoc sp.]
MNLATNLTKKPYLLYEILREWMSYANAPTSELSSRCGHCEKAIAP